MKKRIMGLVALSVALPLWMSTLVRADDATPRTLSDRELEAVTAGAGASITATGSAAATGSNVATITVTGTGVTSDGTTAVAGGFGAGLAGAVGGSTTTDASVGYSADGLTTRVYTQSNTLNAPSWSASYKITGVLTTDLGR